MASSPHAGCLKTHVETRRHQLMRLVLFSHWEIETRPSLMAMPYASRCVVELELRTGPYRKDGHVVSEHCSEILLHDGGVLRRKVESAVLNAGAAITVTNAFPVPLPLFGGQQSEVRDAKNTRSWIMGMLKREAETKHHPY